MGKQMYTVVVWDDGDAFVRPMGPTADERALLGDTVRRARELHAGAEIVRWGRRGAPVRLVQNIAKKRRDDAAAADAAQDEWETTAEQLRALRDEAGAAGDGDTVRDCTAALEGDDAARGRCASIIADAAMRSGPLFAFEARADGQWSREAAGAQDPSNYLDSREAAEAELPRLARTLGCDVSDVRVIEV